MYVEFFLFDSLDKFFMAKNVFLSKKNRNNFQILFIILNDITFLTQLSSEFFRYS